jgi:methenyltetrahydrofolate cyclohydrolase
MTTDLVRVGELTVGELTERLASRDPVPGGGSAAALVGALAAALVRMVVELSTGRPEFASHQPTLDEVAGAADAARRELLDLADRDAAAFAGVIGARRLPRGTDAERAMRSERITAAVREATRIPLRTAEVAASVADLADRVASIGNRNAVSDAGVAAHLAAAATHGAALNVRINLPALADDDPLRAEAAASLERLVAEVTVREAAALDAVEARIG